MVDTATGSLYGTQYGAVYLGRYPVFEKDQRRISLARKVCVFHHVLRILLPFMWAMIRHQPRTTGGGCIKQQVSPCPLPLGAGPRSFWESRLPGKTTGSNTRLFILHHANLSYRSHTVGGWILASMAVWKRSKQAILQVDLGTLSDPGLRVSWFVNCHRDWICIPRLLHVRQSRGVGIGQLIFFACNSSRLI